VPLYEVAADRLLPHSPEQFKGLKIYERADLQRLLRDDISVIDPDLLVVSEEFGNWEDARRRIDLLAIDRDARLVVIELKRTDDGGHMELQALRYAAMVSTMEFKDVLAAFEVHRGKHPGPDVDLEPEMELRGWLDQAESEEDPEISSDVGIVLVSADFGREITTAVIWLNKFEGMDIRCVRLQPYDIEGKVLLDIQQVLPLPEAADYQVKMRRKEAALERARTGGRDYTKYSIVRDGAVGPEMNKRHAVLEMVKALQETGVPLADIKGVVQPSRILFVEGELSDADDVATVFLDAFPKFRPGRWFLDDVFREDGKTYVVSKMWGRNTEPTLKRLQERFSDKGVSFKRGDAFP
jgi:hypothetical protein